MRQHQEPSDDRAIVAAMTAHNIAGVAAVLDLHAPGLYAYCLSRLGKPVEAVEVLRDTIIVAAFRVSRLATPDRLRPWLFAVARNECYRRLRATESAAPLYELYELADVTDVADGRVPEHAELHMLGSSVLAGLDPADREVCELSLYYLFNDADLGDVLGVSCNEAQALARRAISRFEQSLRIPLLARSKRQECSDLAAMLGDWSGLSTALPRKRAERHMERCETCCAPDNGDITPATMHHLVMVRPLPADLRRHLLSVISDTLPGAPGYRARVLDRTALSGVGGFPVQLATPPVPHSRGIPVMAAAFAAAALAVLGGVIFYINNASSHGGSGAPTARLSSHAPTRESSSPSHSRPRSPSPSSVASIFSGIP